MAKKIFINPDEVKRASNALKDFHIEHVLTEYKFRNTKVVRQALLIVKNKDKDEALAAINMAEISVLRVKNCRRFETMALLHTYYQPKFECKCRCCGKTFMSAHKEAVWCSEKCKSDFRKAKKCL